MTSIRIIAAFSAVLGISAAAIAGDYTIVPGKSIGKTYLGESRAEVRRTLGKPSESSAAEPISENAGSRLAMDTWWSGVNQRNIVHVSYQSGRVVQISTDIARFRTADGVSVGSSLALLQRRFLKLEHYTFPSGADPEGRSYTRYFDATAGIGFISTNDSPHFDFVTVFRSNHTIVRDDS